jgi:sterol desaturase/sphingolipid hydroxylase (fatty acid hydroxylase superfamily)
MRQEIIQSMTSMPIMAIFTAPAFYLEVKGYSMLYMDVEKYGWWYMVLQFPLFLMFTDCGIYWIHRGLHHPSIYKHLHKPHHKWIMPTPYASHAFHPIDGFAQSVPYHVFPFVLPLHKFAYIILFTFINVWTVMIRTPLPHNRPMKTANPPQTTVNTSPTPPSSTAPPATPCTTYTSTTTTVNSRRCGIVSAARTASRTWNCSTAKLR